MNKDFFDLCGKPFRIDLVRVFASALDEYAKANGVFCRIDNEEKDGKYIIFIEEAPCENGKPGKFQRWSWCGHGKDAPSALQHLTREFILRLASSIATTIIEEDHLPSRRIH